MLSGEIWIAGRRAKNDLCKTMIVIYKTKSDHIKSRILSSETISDLCQARNIIGKTKGDYVKPRVLSSETISDLCQTKNAVEQN